MITLSFPVDMIGLEHDPAQRDHSESENRREIALSKL